MPCICRKDPLWALCKLGKHTSSLTLISTHSIGTRLGQYTRHPVEDNTHSVSTSLPNKTESPQFIPLHRIRYSLLFLYIVIIHIIVQGKCYQRHHINRVTLSVRRNIVMWTSNNVALFAIVDCPDVRRIRSSKESNWTEPCSYREICSLDITTRTSKVCVTIYIRYQVILIQRGYFINRITEFIRYII